MTLRRHRTGALEFYFVMFRFISSYDGVMPSKAGIHPLAWRVTSICVIFSHFPPHSFGRNIHQQYSVSMCSYGYSVAAGLVLCRPEPWGWHVGKVLSIVKSEQGKTRDVAMSISGSRSACVRTTSGGHLRDEYFSAPAPVYTRVYCRKLWQVKTINGRWGGLGLLVDDGRCMEVFVRWRYCKMCQFEF